MILVVGLNSLVYINCFEIQRREVLGKQKYYLLKHKALLFLFLQIFFSLILDLQSFLLHFFFLVILTFSLPNGIVSDKGSRLLILHSLVSFLNN